MATTDSSSITSETDWSDVLIRDGGLCVLCGEDPVDVAHIVASKADEGIMQLPFICNIAQSLTNFEKDELSNLICLCGTHYRQYDDGLFVFVPSESQRKALTDYELSDFTHRESLFANGQPDPGRTLPNILCNEIEYIPIHRSRFRACIHNPTRYDQEMFFFDTYDQYPCPLLHFQASAICLMVEAQFHLSNFLRLKTERADVAELEVTMLLKLYLRRPGGGHNNPITIPTSYPPASTAPPPSNLSGTSILPTISSSTPTSHFSTTAVPEIPLNGLTSNSPAGTMDPCEDTVDPNDIYAQIDSQQQGTSSDMERFEA